MELNSAKASTSSEADQSESQEKDLTGNRSRSSSANRGEEIKNEADQLVTNCYNNLAACIIYGPNRTKEDYMRAVDYCDKVLIVNSTNEKARYRKGYALSKALSFESAIFVLRDCSGSEAKKLITECEEKLNEERRRLETQIRRNFRRHEARNRQNAEGVGGINLPQDQRAVQDQRAEPHVVVAMNGTP